MKKYIPSQIEPKWQKKWKEEKLFSIDLDHAPKPFYSLMMFPYPSAEGMHVGNMYAFTGSDIYSRFKRLQGFDVFEPIGLDGFGIHGENYALKINEHPMEVSKRTEKHFFEQFMAIGNAYDWDHTVETYKPEYYKWTQWAFLQLYKKGIAYRKKAEVNWCPSCKTVLADEQVIAGECERCASPVEKKQLEQWFFKITDYAERLLKNLECLPAEALGSKAQVTPKMAKEGIDWSEKIKVAQRNWIGKSEGINFKEKVKHLDMEFEVFDTVPQTFLAQTFTVIAPEHPLVLELVAGTEYEKSVMEFVERMKKKKMTQGLEVEKEVEGIFTGRYVDDPFGTGDLPIWVASYAIYGYGTGMVNCSAHDERDFAFAKKYDIPLKIVMLPSDKDLAKKVQDFEICYHHEPEGIIQEPAEFKGMTWEEAREPIISYIEKEKLGSRGTHYHLRDWLISRQRYWGPPIPIIYCDPATAGCGIVPVPEKDLPVVLPYIKDFRPTGKGVSPLASDPDFVNVKCPKCGGSAKRETDVSDNFLDSALYYFRYLTTEMPDKFFDEGRTKKWLPVDMYIGGAEHSVLHLLYSRFITMVFKDLGLIDFEEPFEKFRAHGLIIAEGAKMSKSKGNVVNPDEFIKEWGADTLRIYLMFMGPFTEGGDFRAASVSGAYRFLTRVWDLTQREFAEEPTKDELKILHKTIKKVGEDIEGLRLNTAISSLMELLNFLSRQKSISRETLKAFLVMIAPFAPHITEELYQNQRISADKDHPWESIHMQPWPKFDEKQLEEEEISVAIQVNGKVRDVLLIQKDLLGNRDVVEKMAFESEKIQKFLAGKSVKKTVYIPGKIISFFIGSE